MRSEVLHEAAPYLRRDGVADVVEELFVALVGERFVGDTRQVESTQLVAMVMGDLVERGELTREGVAVSLKSCDAITQALLATRELPDQNTDGDGEASDDENVTKDEDPRDLWDRPKESRKSERQDACERADEGECSVPCSKKRASDGHGVSLVFGFRVVDGRRVISAA